MKIILSYLPRLKKDKKIWNKKKLNFKLSCRKEILKEVLLMLNNNNKINRLTVFLIIIMKIFNIEDYNIRIFF